MTTKRDTPVRSFLTIAIAGVAILLLYVLLQANKSSGPSMQVVVSVEQQQRIIANFKNTWQREPNEVEMHALIKVYTRQEIAWREAMRLSLGGDDPEIRRRMQQQLETATTDEADPVPATRDELQNFLDEHADEFRADPLLTFRQIYFDNTDNVIGADAAARFLLGRLRNQEMPDDISKLGDPSTLPAYFEEVRGADIVPLFGRNFSSALSAAPVEAWAGPVSSDLGLHIVFIDKRIAGRIPELDEIEPAVNEKWQDAKRADAVEGMYRRLADRYDIVIE